MAQAAARQVDDTDLTLKLAENSMSFTLDGLPKEAVEVARHCFLDWLGVTLAGSREPLAGILLKEALSEGGNPQATVIGDGRKVSIQQAALINGSAGHALDYDDVHLLMPGHPTVPVVPALLALAEYQNRDGKDFLTALVAGIEAECRVGAIMNQSHYGAGWHATGTVGTFGATAAAAKLLGLNAKACANAMGIGGTQAAGLRSMFGTMCKPFHAGKAAVNGLSSALLSQRGFESRPDVLECEQGFADTQTENYDPAAALDGLGDVFHTPDVLFKYHAACYGTHASIEAAAALKREHNIDPDNVADIEVHVRGDNLRICNILNPVTGLEGKFSLRFTAAMALLGENTAVIANYNEQKVQDPEIVAVRDKISVHVNDDLGLAQSDVVISMKDGTVHKTRADVETPDTDLDRQWSRLRAKFTDMATPVISAAGVRTVIDAVRNLETCDDIAEIAALCGKPAGNDV
ncbi:MAG: MmgE/PrpD family protein [Alphaproteobacteria bacterium]|nr:MmgE/PrpD family protein [Alphaproteobacteria bacterium]